MSNDDLEDLLRQGLSQLDGPDPEYSNFAKLSYEFRDLATADLLEPEKEFAGSRDSALETGTSAVTFNGNQLAWETPADGVSGAILPARSVRIVLCTTNSSERAIETDEDGSFLFKDADPGVSRIIVEDEEPWATPWFRIPRP